MNLTLKQFPQKRSKYLNSFLIDDDRSLIVSRKFSGKFKENFSHHGWKHNVSINSRNEVNTKNIGYYMADSIQEMWYDSKPSADGKKS